MKASAKNNVVISGYFLMVLLFIIRFIPFFNLDGRFWGFNHLIFLSNAFAIIYAVIAIIALILPFFRQTSQISEAFIDGFSEIFFESKYKYIHRLIFIAVLSAFFIIFAAPTHFLGDGYTALSNLASDSGTVLRWSEKGITLLHSIVQSLLGPKNKQTSLLTFQIMAIFSEVISIWFFFLIAEFLSDNKSKRVLIFFTSVLSGILLLFFGYVENYPLIWIALTGFVYFGLRYMTSGRSLAGGLFFLVLGIFIHLQMSILIPAFVFLIFCRGRGLAVYRQYRALLISLAIVFVIGGFIIFIHLYKTDLYFEDIFLPLFTGKGLSPTNFAFSVTHLTDMVNELLLLSPIFPILIVLSFNEFKHIFKNGVTFFLTIITLSSFLFVLFIDPKIGMGRDWDLFSFLGFGFTLLLVYSIPEKHLTALKKYIPTMIIYLIVTTVPYLLMNLNRDTSIKYAKYLIDLDPEKSYSNLVIMRLYYQESGDRQTADSLNAVFFERFPNEKKIFDASNVLNRGDITGAKEMAADIVPDRLSGRYHNFLSALYMSEGIFDKALEESDMAIQLGMYNYRFFVNRAWIFSQMKQYEKALESVRVAYNLFNNNDDVLSAFAWINILADKPDSAIIYAYKLIALDSGYVSGYYFLCRAYADKKLPDSSLRYYNLYQSSGHMDVFYVNKLAELKHMIEELQ